MKGEKLLIVGYGRIGKLLGTVLQTDFHVSVLDVKRPRLPRTISRVTPRDIGKFPLVLLALPIHRLEGFLRREGKKFAPGSFVADVSALKEAPMKWMRRYLPPTVSYCGLHPLFGPDSARGGLSGHGVVVCRGRVTVQCHRRLLRTLRKHRLKIIETDPVTHDKTISSTLFLTQWVGRILPPELMTGTPPFENTASPLLRMVAGRAGYDRDHILRDLCRFSPFPARMLRRVTRRSVATALRLGKKPSRRGD